jgi:hypothetical protein
LAVLGGLLQGLGVPGGSDLATTLETLLNSLSIVNGTLGGVSQLVDAVNSILPVDISLTDLIGLTATQTEYSNVVTWLGLTDQTNIGNTYVNLAPITLTGLLNNLTGTLGGSDGLLSTVLGNLLGTNALSGLLGSLPIGQLGTSLPVLGSVLGALDIVNTPDVTVWIPAGSGSYDLPLGGSFGWLAAMPTIAIGPLGDLVDANGVSLSTLANGLGLSSLLGGADLNSATVIAIPISGAGLVLPGNLASAAFVNVNVLFPTATGVTSLAGTSLQTLNIPLLSTTVTNLNTLQAYYVGTNGYNLNSGQSVMLLSVGGVPIPIEYSLGAVNFGTTGVGGTLPSLFGVGLVPSFQIGTPVGQESSDGLIGNQILNIPLNAPTQATDVATLIGLGGAFAPAEQAGTSVWNATALPVGNQIKSYLNDNWGGWADSFGQNLKQVTGQFADATGGSATPFSTLSAASTQQQPSAQVASSPVTTSTPSTSTPTITNPLSNIDDLTNVSANLNTTINTATTKIKTAAADAQSKTEAAVKNAQTSLNKIASDGQAAIKKVGDDVKKSVNDTVKKVSDAAKNATAKKAG